MEEELLKALQTAISYLQMGKKDQSIIDELKAVAEKAREKLEIINKG